MRLLLAIAVLVCIVECATVAPIIITSADGTIVYYDNVHGSTTCTVSVDDCAVVNSVVSSLNTAYLMWSQLAGLSSYDGYNSPFTVIFPDSISTAWDYTTRTFKVCPCDYANITIWHEFGHATTLYMENFLHTFQSASLDETWSDIIAHSIDLMFSQTSGSACGPCGTDTTGVWNFGRYYPQSSNYLGFRDLKDPSCLNYKNFFTGVATPYPSTVADMYCDCPMPGTTDSEKNMLGQKITTDTGGCHTNMMIFGKVFATFVEALWPTYPTTAVDIAFNVFLAAKLSARTTRSYRPDSSSNFYDYGSLLLSTCTAIGGTTKKDHLGNNLVIPASVCTTLNSAVSATGYKQAIPCLSDTIIPESYPVVGTDEQGGLVSLSFGALTSATTVSAVGTTSNPPYIYVVNPSTVTLPPDVWMTYVSFEAAFDGAYHQGDQYTLTNVQVVFDNDPAVDMPVYFYPMPTITSVSPTRIENAGPVDVTIKGTNFFDVRTVNTQTKRCATDPTNNFKYQNPVVPQCIFQIEGGSDTYVEATIKSSSELTCQMPNLYMDNMTSIKVFVTMHQTKNQYTPVNRVASTEKIIINTKDENTYCSCDDNNSTMRPAASFFFAVLLGLACLSFTTKH